MYKLIIVEDEDKIRKGIVNSITWKEYGFEIIAEAINGVDALEKMKIEKPDVVVTDVRMPVMDGLELASKINDLYENVKIIILSGYSDFDFVRSALKFQVYDYLLKPTDIDVFIDTFKTLKLSLDEEQKKRLNMQRQQKLLQQNFTIMRREFILNMVTAKPELISTIQDRLDFFEINLSGDNYLAVVIRIEGNTAGDINNDGNEGDHTISDYSKIIEGALNDNDCAVFAVKDIQEIIIVFHFYHDDFNMQYILNIIKSILLKLTEVYGCTVSAGVGLNYPFIYQINRSYIQANKAIEKKFFHKERDIFIYEESEDSYINNEKQWIINYPYEINTIISETLSTNTEKVNSLLDMMFDQCIKKEIDSKFIKDYCYVMLFLLAQNLSDIQEVLTTKILLTDIKNGINNKYSIDSLKDYVKNYLINVCMQIKAYKESKNGYNNKIIESIKKHLHDNFHKEISLEELSKLFHFSAPYISFLFKSTTGENYMDFLRRIRMEKAKEYLEKGELKIYEIANNIGYSDYKYFTLQFKKLYGMSPSEYRENRLVHLKP